MTLEKSSSDRGINIRIFAKTDVGMVRQGNEDNFLAVDLSTGTTWTADNPEPPFDLLSFTQGQFGSLFAVSDGMGGALAGEVASQQAVTSVRDWMVQLQQNPRFQTFPFHERLRLSVEQANLRIHTQSQANPEYAGMGATFTAAGLEDSTLYLAQIGDSRAYLIRKSRIVQMTKDQSLVAQLVAAGHITEDEAENHHYRNVILQALGATPTVIVVVDGVQLCNDDVVLLCSDGLSGKVRGSEMLDIFSTCNGDLPAACGRLIQTANERGGEDNITVVLLHFHGSGLPEPIDDGTYDIHVIQRDPKLPDEVDQSILISEEPTLSAKSNTNAFSRRPSPTAVLSVQQLADFSSDLIAPPPPPPMPTPSPSGQWRNVPLIAASILVISIVLVIAYFSFRPQKPTTPVVTESPPKSSQPPPAQPASDPGAPANQSSPPEQKSPTSQPK